MTRRFSQRRTLFPFFLFFFLIETRPVEGIERGDKLTRVSHDASFPLFRDPPAARGRFRFTRVPRTALVKRIDRKTWALSVFPPFGETFRSMDGV